MTTSASKSVTQSSPALLVSPVEAQRISGSPLGVMVSSVVANTQPVYVGGSDVTISTGTLVGIGEYAMFEMWGSDSLYAIGVSGTQDIRVLIGPFVRNVSI